MNAKEALQEQLSLIGEKSDFLVHTDGDHCNPIQKKGSLKFIAVAKNHRKVFSSLIEAEDFIRKSKIGFGEISVLARSTWDKRGEYVLLATVGKTWTQFSLEQQEGQEEGEWFAAMDDDDDDDDTWP